MIQMLELADKEFKAAIIKMLQKELQVHFFKKLKISAKKQKM